MTKSFSGNGHQELEEGVPSRAAPTRALIIGPYSTRKSAARASGGGPSAGLAEERSASERLDEATKLAGAIDLVVVDSIIVPVNDIRPATYIGSGKVEELAARVKAEEIDLAVVDCALSPVQQRNLEKALGAKVIDRTALILEIFGERARTREGSLQVEHAHLTHQKSRLVRSWTHLERQRGGFGFLGGPGETQIEADRRQIEERIAKIERDLDAVKRTRALHRRQRRLFNRLTAAGVVAKDMLFATLDPTARLISLPHGESVYLIDTVGFISDLPTSLIAAFRATLEDVLDADLIIHVRDVSHAENEAQRRDVEDVLAELGLDRSSHPTLEVHNKIDLLHGERAPALANGDAAAADHEPIGISALTGDGIDELLAAIETMLFRNRDVFDLVIPGTDGRGRAWVYEHAEVLSAEEDTGGSARLMVRVSRDRSAELLRLVAAGGGEVSVHP
jgi:GTP-binding protein HflX